MREASQRRYPAMAAASSPFVAAACADERATAVISPGVSSSTRRRARRLWPLGMSSPVEMSSPADSRWAGCRRRRASARGRRGCRRRGTDDTYLAVAMLGTDQDRAVFRKAVNRQHAQVVSTPDEPVQYRAMDPRLQTWVAACLYYGTVDMIEKMHGPIDDETADALYAYGARFGTTLQMPAEAWPKDRAAFDEYWEASLAEVRIDEPVREMLMTLIRLDNMPWWLQEQAECRLRRLHHDRVPAPGVPRGDEAVVDGRGSGEVRPGDAALRPTRAHDAAVAAVVPVPHPAVGHAHAAPLGSTSGLTPR